MNATVREWVRKADTDFNCAVTLLRPRKKPVHDAVCFHAQQCAEKLMKAVLIHGKMPAPRTHDLAELSRLLKLHDPTWIWPDRELHLLSQAAVLFRYPGSSATKADARAAVAICKRLRDRLLGMLV